MTESGGARVLSSFGTRTIGAILNFALSHTTQSQLRRCVTSTPYAVGTPLMSFLLSSIGTSGPTWAKRLCQSIARSCCDNRAALSTKTFALSPDVVISLESRLEYCDDSSSEALKSKHDWNICSSWSAKALLVHS